ncbi:MAG: aromatic amino acid transport family protein [bacterium]
MKNFLYAVALLIGTIIGVGVFGIPYVAAQAGFSIALIYLAGLGIIILLIHLFYAEIVLKTPGKHRLVGYAEKHLGKWGKNIATVSSVFGLYGALLAYIIVAGQFLKVLFAGSAFNWSLVFFLFGALFIFLGLKLIAQAEFFMTGLLFAAMIIIFVFGWGHIDWQNLSTLNFSYFFLPYGVIFFALGGIEAIPQMRELVNNKKLKLAVVLGTLIPVILFIIFVIVVLGVTGPNTTQEALIGLQQILGPKIMLIGLIFGVLALMTSFLTLGLNLKEIFWYDYKINKNLAWVLACFVPLLFFILGIRNFIDVIGLVGAILGGINGLIIAVIYGKLKKSWFLPGIVILVFVLGIILSFQGRG